MRRLGRLAAALALFAAAGCVRVKVEPIHITMDVNVKVKVDRELDSFFGDLDAKRPAPDAATAPGAGKPAENGKG